MTLDYSIQSIGSPFGNYGLGGYNAYSPYYPSFGMGMTPGLTAGIGMMPGMTPGMMTTMPGMGVYSTESMMKMQQEWQKSQQQLMIDMQKGQFGLQRDMAVAQLQHDQEMHDLTKDYQLSNQRKSFHTDIQQSLTTGSIESAVENLYHKIREGDGEGVVEEFQKAKDAVYRICGSDLTVNGVKTNYDAEVIRIIKDKYAAYATSIDGAAADIESDIKEYCEGAGKNGFMQGWHEDHSELYAEEIVEKCFGRRVDNKGSKDFRQEVGKWTGTGTHLLGVGLGGGAAAGGALASIGLGLSKIFTPNPSKPVKPVKWYNPLSWGNKAMAAAGKKAHGASWTGTLKKGAKWGAIAGLALDVVWKFCLND